MKQRTIALALALAFACRSASATAEDAAGDTSPAAAPATDAAAPQRPAGCAIVASLWVPLSVCLVRGQWAYAHFAPAAEHSIKNLKRDVYLMIVGEPTQLTLPAMKEAIFANVKKVATMDKVREDDAVELDSHRFGHLVFNSTIKDLHITYEYFYTDFAGVGSAQVILYTLTDEFEELSPVRASVIDTLRVEDGAD